MSNLSFFNKVREFIAGIAWRVYLCAARMTEEQFLAEHRRQAIEQQRVRDANPATCPNCGGEDWHHSVECYLGQVSIHDTAEDKEKTFEEVVKPVIKWLSKNKHPHMSIIIDGTHGELVEGVESVITDEFVPD